MAYDLNGVQYPSVTTITGMLDKPALLSWASNCAVDHIQENIEVVQDKEDVHRGEDVLQAARKAYAQKRDKAATSGTRCHNAIEAHIKGEDSRVIEILGDDEQANIGYKAFQEWEETNHVEWEQVECTVFCLSIGYAGRFDAIAKINGHRYLIDFKTSSGIYDEMKYQLCAYKQAYNEMLEDGQEPIEKVAILHLDKKTGEPTFKPILKNIMRYTILFNYLVKSYYLMKNRRLKNNPFVKEVKEI